MGSPCRGLLEHSIGLVTAEDIAACAPNDPGYPDYVREFVAVLRSGELPPEASFDVTETIGLTRWGTPESRRDPQQFRRFRTFTNAVGMAMAAEGKGSDMMPANYFAISLIDDVDALADPELLARLGPAFAEYRERLAAESDDDAPFLLLAILIVAAMRKTPHPDAAAIVARLIEEASPDPVTKRPRKLLWGCTHFDQLHERWEDAVRRFLLAGDDPVGQLREALLRARPDRRGGP